MKKCNLQSLKELLKYLMIIFLPILVYIILGIILNYSLNNRLARAKSPTVAEPLLSIAGKTMYSSSLGT